MTKPIHTMTPEQLAEWERRAKDGTLFSTPGGLPTAAAVLRNIAYYRWPDKRLPWGAQAQLVEETGLSQGWVNSILREEGFVSNRRKTDGQEREPEFPADADKPAPVDSTPSRRDQLIAEERERLAQNRPDAVREFLGGDS